MDINVLPVGGFNEVGMNMVAVEVGDEIIILDMGFYMPKLVEMSGQHEDKSRRNAEYMLKHGVIPNDKALESKKSKVKAIVSTHCHLDHIGAIPYLAGKYKCPIIATPYTNEVLETMLKDEKIRLPNHLIDLEAGMSYKISNNITVEFINSTHSTPQTVFAVIHTPEGAIVYSNDYKLDNHPVLGRAPDYNRLKKVSSKGVLCLIVDSLYSNYDLKTPSEKVAKEMLKDVLFGTNNEGKAIITTTFASQIARLKSITEFARKLDRKPVFLGRSLAKYTLAAQNVDLIQFPDVEIVGYAREVKRKLKEIERKRDKYLVVCTGNQAEPGAILTRIGRGELPFKFTKHDHVIFSCRTIPVSPNIENRRDLEQELKSKRARLFLDIHASGHGGREDNRDLIELLNPKHIIPAHGSHEHVKGMVDLAEELGYVNGKTLHVADNHIKINLK